MRSRTKPSAERILSLLPTLLLVAAFCIKEPPSAVLILLFAVILHEGAHAACLLALGSLPRIRGVMGGFLLGGNRPLSSKEEVLVAASGPLANLAVGGICLLLLRLCGFHGWLFTLMTVNLLTALCNLAPLRGSDGGRLLRTLLCLWFGKPGGVLAGGISTLLAGFFFFLAIYLFYLGQVGLPLPVFAAATLLRVTVEEGEQERIWENL